MSAVPMNEAERANAILEARARALAQAPPAPPASDTEELLTFRLARETYAIETRVVHAVFALASLTPLPGARPPLYGVTLWRGDVLTILDLRLTLGGSAAGLDDLSRVIVVGERRPAFGILADELRETVTLAPDELFPRPEHRAGAREYVRGVTRDATLVLDAAELLRRHADSH